MYTLEKRVRVMVDGESKVTQVTTDVYSLRTDSGHSVQALDDGQVIVTLVHKLEPEAMETLFHAIGQALEKRDITNEADREASKATLNLELKKRLDLPVEELELLGRLGMRVRILNVFSDSNIVYIGQIILLGEAYLLRRRNFSRKSLAILKDALELLGLSFKTDATGWRPSSSSAPLAWFSATLHLVQGFLF